jgi:hypothetical protein
MMELVGQQSNGLIQQDVLLGGAGIQTAGLAFGGNPVTYLYTATEEYNGTSWASNPTGLNTAREAPGEAGTQTAGLAFGGYSGPGTDVTLAATELYDGTSWTSNPTGLNTARQSLAGAGTQTAGLAIGGYAGPGVQNATEEWTGAGAPLTQTITVS